MAFTLEHVFDEDAALSDVLVDGELLIVRSYEENHSEAERNREDERGCGGCGEVKVRGEARCK